MTYHHCYVVVLCLVMSTAAIPYQKCGVCMCERYSMGVTAQCIGLHITSVPQDLPANVTRLHLDHTGIETLNKTSFGRYTALYSLFVRHNLNLKYMDGFTFIANPSLYHVEMSNNPKLTDTHPNAFDGVFSNIRYIYLIRNALRQVPNFSRMVLSGSTLAPDLHLDGNPLTVPAALCGEKAAVPARTDDITCHFVILSIQHTQMGYMPSYVLNGTKIEVMYMNDNRKLVGFDDDIFTKIAPNSLKELVLSNNTAMKNIPSQGVNSIEVFKCERCPSLRVIPPTVNFENIGEAYLTYPQHCCAFRKPELQNKTAYDLKIEADKMRCKESRQATTTSPQIFIPFADNSTTIVTPTPIPFLSYSTTTWFGFLINQGKKITDDLGLTTTQSPPISMFDEDYDFFDQYFGDITFSDTTIDPNKNHFLLPEKNCTDEEFERLRDNLRCYPQENSFTPCVDILEENNYLRIPLWFVALSAIVGNLVVLIFTITSRTRTKQPMSVTKFLICNLAFSDLLQGIYLLTLAAVDVKSLGQYFNIAMWWQTEGGCDVIGFVTIFASELSVYTLAVITLERWYAISHAIHLTKRVQMRHAMVIMGFGWIFAASIAMLPLPAFQFSSYQDTSICLPFRYDSVKDKGYIIALLVLNVSAFILVFVCYASIFLQVRGSNASRASDMYLARRMALLVFTDFVCWGPVAIVAGLSAGGVRVQSSFINDESGLFIAKIILVIFYPFNACTNPFLYAIITKQFRKDCRVTLNSCGITCCNKNKPHHQRDDTQQRHTRETLKHTTSCNSNTTQMTNTLSVSEHRAASIKSKSSIEALIAVANSLNSGHMSRASYDSARRDSIREYAMQVLDNKPLPATNCGGRKLKRHSFSGAPLVTNSSIDSTESRRPSDTVRVPETLEELDSTNYDDSWNTGYSHHTPWESHQTREQWHRDRWLFEAEHSMNKRYTSADKCTDIDSGTDLNHICESDCEEYRTYRQDSTSTCSTYLSNNNNRRRSSYVHQLRSQSEHNRQDSYELDSECECCSNHSNHSRHIDKVQSYSGPGGSSGPGVSSGPSVTLANIKCDESFTDSNHIEKTIACNRAENLHKHEDTSVTQRLTAVEAL